MTKPPRFFITPDQINDREITITGEDVRHIRTVLRKLPGDLLTLLDGKGMEYTVNIAESGQSKIIAEIIHESKRNITYPRVILGQGLPKSDKMDWIAQKTTELGIAELVPLVTERTIVKLKNEQGRLERWQKICREAAMQSGRADIPHIAPVQKMSDFLQGIPKEEGGISRSDTLLLLPWEEGSQPIKETLQANPGVKKIIVMIGPEGGFSQTEVGMARDRGFHPVSLGENILRTETAGIAVLSMILYEYF